jgi:hypothetical protein
VGDIDRVLAIVSFPAKVEARRNAHKSLHDFAIARVV